MLEENVNYRARLTPENQHRYDFGHGVFNLAFSLIPQNLLRIIKFIGIAPDKSDGLQKLESCRAVNSIRSVHAGLVLCLYGIEYDISSDGAYRILQDLFKQYPHCPLFFWIGSIVSWKLCQDQDAFIMIKSSIWHCGKQAEEALFLQYELACYYFVCMKWESAIFHLEKILVRVLSPNVIKNQKNDNENLLKSLKLQDIYDPTLFTYDDNLIKHQNESATCIIPHLTNVLIQVAATKFQLDDEVEGMKWLLTSVIVSKKYVLYRNTIEEDFGKLAQKYLSRSCKFMLTYELFYFLRHLPRLPDEQLLKITNSVDAFLQNLPVEPLKLHDKDYYATCKQDHIADFFSGMLIITINNCLLGETLAVCTICDGMLPLFDIVKEDQLYIIHQLVYWFARALIAEERTDDAKKVLKIGMKMKKTEFNITNKIKKLLNEISSS
jgi:hypothetical protein